MDITSLIGSAIPDFGAPSLQNLEFESAPGQPGVLQVKQNGRQYVRFYNKDVYNALETQRRRAANPHETVLPVYEKRLMVQIDTPGDTNRFDDVAHDYHKRNYFSQYGQYKDGKTGPTGTPLKDADFLVGVEIEDLIYARIFTIEQLGDASDTMCENLPRGYEIREHARAWCKVNDPHNGLLMTKKLSSALSESQGTIKALLAEQEKSRQEMEAMKADLIALSTNHAVERAVEEVGFVSEAPKKKTTRAKKVTTEEVK